MSDPNKCYLCDYKQRRIEKQSDEIEKLKQLKEAIFRILNGDNPTDIDIVYKLVLERGCETYERGNPLDGYDFYCKHDYEWTCDNCPCVVEKEKADNA